MAGYQGMDPSVVRGVAQRLRAQAEHLNGSMSDVQRSVDDAISHWDGEDAHSFNSWWTTHYRPGITATQQSLVEMASALERNIEEQERASGVTSSSGSLSSPAAAVTPATLLQFAAAAYGPANPLPPGWRDLSPAELTQLGLSPQDFHLANGMDARLVTDGQGHYVLTYAGTKGGTDWGQNGLSALSDAGVSVRSSQVEDSVDLANRVSSVVGAGNLTLTGHSLGGRDAAVASIATGATAVTFNAAGATDEDILYAQAVAGNEQTLAAFALSKLTFGASTQLSLDDSSITNYVSSDDPLTFAQQYVPGAVSDVLRDALGHQVVVPDLSLTITDPLGGHDLSTFDGKI